MKKFIAIFCLIVLFSISTVHAQCCSSVAKAANCTEEIAMKQNTVDAKAEVIYFHATRRCATCQAVETVTTETLKQAFGVKVSFQSINREEDNKNPLIEKYKISGQTLLIIKGDKVVNLTNEAFLNARTNPDKFKKKLKSTIESM